MTASGETMRRSAAAISPRRAMTPASGVGISMRKVSHRARGDAIRAEFTVTASRDQRPKTQELQRKCGDFCVIATPGHRRRLARDSALARLEARIGLVDHEHPPAPTHHAAVLVALL